jgi:hypothetical protein
MLFQFLYLCTNNYNRYFHRFYGQIQSTRNNGKFLLLTTSGNNNYYINWHVVDFRRFRCCRGIWTNMFSSEHVMYFKFFTTLFGSMFYDRINYTRITNMYCSYFNSWVFVHVVCFIRSTITIGTTSTFFFQLWQVSIGWPILPQLVHVNVDLDVTIGITSLTTALAYDVVSITL